ncbi:MAG: hypothetical protein KDE55_21185 [Novosphingobium sp.]|nr:hypothetical protein [Novosphingobium sp.]
MKALVKGALTILGGLMMVMGLLWIGQGSGIVMWPASSFMLADPQWAINGAILALLGLVLLWLALRKI